MAFATVGLFGAHEIRCFVTAHKGAKPMNKAGRPGSSFLSALSVVGLLCCGGFVTLDSRAETADLAVTGAVAVVSEATNLDVLNAP